MLKKIILFVPFLLCAGPPMLTDDPDVPNFGEVEINFSSQLEKRETDTLTMPIVDFNYGIFPKVQFTVESGYLWENSQHDFGETEIALKYNFYSNDIVSLALYPHYIFYANNSLFKESNSWEMMLPMSFKLSEKLSLVSSLTYIKPTKEQSHVEFGSYLEYENNADSYYVEGYWEEEAQSKDRLLVNLGYLHEFDEGLAFIGSVGYEVQSRQKRATLGYLGLQVSF